MSESRSNAQPPARKFALGIGALMAGLVLYWGEPFSGWAWRRLVPGLLILLGLLAIVPRVGAFLSWSLQRKDRNP